MKKTSREKQEINWLIAKEIPALRRYAQILMQGRGDKDDLVQDTLERAINKSHTWRREGNIRSWLYRIEYTVFLNKYRKTALKEVAGEDMIEHMADAATATQNIRLECRKVLRALDHVKPRHREVLMLVAVEGFSYDEAAAIMDIPVGTVRSRLARAREDLRGALKKTGLTGENIRKSDAAPAGKEIL